MEEGARIDDYYKEGNKKACMTSKCKTLSFYCSARYNDVLPEPHARIVSKGSKQTCTS